MTERQQQLADYISRHPVLAPYARPALARRIPPRYSAYQLPAAQQLAQAFLEDAEFRSLNLGNWLGTMDGELIAEAVSAVIPPEYSAAFNVAVEGLKLAASLQAKEGRQTAGKVAVFAICVAIVLGLASKGA
jgi:hypothetical protein